MILLTFSVLRTRHNTLNTSQFRHFLSSVVPPQDKLFTTTLYTASKPRVSYGKKLLKHLG